MPATRGVKRTASKSSASVASTGPKNKKKRNVTQLEVPTLPKRRGRVLTCGQGDVGQLGLGEDVIETTRFKHVTGLGEKIVDTCAGGMHTVALDSDGKVWTFGCNDEGALGRPTSGDSDEGRPGAVALPRACVAISAGDSHSAALLDNGDVYAWGAFRDSHGSMGLVVRGREGKPCREPVAVPLPDPAAGIASGGDHLVILTTSGSVYTMGCGEQGQLGRLSQRSASRDTRQGFSALLVPSKVTLKAGASRVWAGYHATFVLDASQEKMFAWGLNNYGQLGITGEKRKTALYAPTACDAFPAGGGWRRVAAGQHHSLALDGAGLVHAIGRVEYGRLGLGDRSGDAEVLEPIPKLQNKKCVSIAAGTSNSFAVTDTGEIYAWGMGSEGQLGTGGSADATEPTLAVSSAMQGHTPIHVAAGGQHTVLLVEDPNAKREASPAPEKETEEEKIEEKSEEEPEPEPEKPKGRGHARGRKQEQEEEVSSSTSSAHAQDVAGDAAPQARKRRTTHKAASSKKKVNGDEKKATPMEIDETDNKQDKDKKEDKDTDADAKTESSKEASKPETTDSSSQDTVESDKPSSEDVEMQEPAAEANPSQPEAAPTQEPEAKEPPKAVEVNVNGAQEEPVETKTVEALSAEALTTTA
ncbi:regulator of chromosome condensation-like isoform X2 [Pectinophora gossypiella]|uniref:regulator of chromosome condensation-like isoform X2 n=1 Tax=Pectinophora gossypiella TaxID=13191 RepID=UPI00214EBD02|nr:regulator of chromosome condensation-like isoform X2 [Pectinophora gossypiella]